MKKNPSLKKILATKAKKGAKGAKDAPLGCGLLTDKQAKKLEKWRLKQAKMPTSSKDAIQIQELTEKLKVAHDARNELFGIRACLKREFPDRTFDPYTPNAVLAICTEFKRAVAKSARDLIMPIYRTSTDDGEAPRSGDMPINERPEAESGTTSGCGCGCILFVALVLLAGAVVMLA